MPVRPASSERVNPGGPFNLFCGGRKKGFPRPNVVHPGGRSYPRPNWFIRAGLVLQSVMNFLAAVTGLITQLKRNNQALQLKHKSILII